MPCPANAWCPDASALPLHQHVVRSLPATLILRPAVAALLLLPAVLLAQSPLPDIRIMDVDVFPESITSTQAGRVYAGSTKGIVYRAEPGAAEAHPWIRPDERNGILSILGVLADEPRNTFWLCSAPNFFGPEPPTGTTALKAFVLDSGAFKGSYDFPAPAGTCNDITIAADGSAYASDTGNGRLFRLAPGASALELMGSDPALVGIDGLAFSASGTLYANNVRSQKLFRLELDRSGHLEAVSELRVSEPLGGPDALRLVAGNRFLQAESSAGRLSVLHIEGDSVSMQVLRADLGSAPGATVVGNTAYVTKTSIQYLLDPALRGQQAPPAMLYAVPLSAAD